MSFFKRRRNLGTLLLGAWLILSGLAQLISQFHFQYMEPILGALAIAAGVLILLDR
jgi:uncharacterized membrane protein HdeD (DUF308 family)